MTDLAMFDTRDAITTEALPLSLAGLAMPAPSPATRRPRMSMRWDMDAATGRLACRWISEG